MKPDKYPRDLQPSPAGNRLWHLFGHAWWSYLPASLLFSLVCWAIFRVILTGWGWLIWKLGWAEPVYSEQFYYSVNPNNEGWNAALLGVWTRWDAIHYIRIIDHGYASEELSVFFPLSPLLGRAVSQILGVESILGLIIVSNLFLVLAATLLFEISAELYGRKTAQQTVISLFIYPMAIFLFAPYTESLALALILLTYLAVHKRKWWLAILGGIAAGLTRGTVVPLTCLLLFDLWQNRKSLSRLEWTTGIISAGAPLAGISLFLAWRTSIGFPGYGGLQTAIWGRETVWPWEPILATPDFIRQGAFPLIGYFNLFLLVMVIGISVWMRPKLPMAFTVYQFSAIIFTLSTTIIREPLGSWGRFSLLLFPTYIMLGVWNHTPRRRLWTYSFMIMLMLLIAGQYFMWGWLG